MTETVVIGHRFRGPPDSGNGGYSSGLIAAHLDAPAEVTLRRPPPLETPLRVERASGDAVRVLDGDVLVAEAVTRRDDLGVDIPEPVPVETAAVAAQEAFFAQHPEEHPFPGCFVCGPHRDHGDGMRILVGPVAGRGFSAAAWTPAADLAGDGGAVRGEFVWAALDCPSGIGAFGEDLDAQSPYVLGRLAVEPRGPVRVGEEHVVLGWRIDTAGRKLTSGSAIYTGDGDLCGLARATWISLK